MKTDWLYILIPTIIQGQYDFNIWYGYFNEKSGHKWELFYRLCKEFADIIITGIIMLIETAWNYNLLGAFFVFKIFGWCDAVYIAIWKIFNPGQKYTEKGIWWMWWTPLGMKRSSLIYNPNIADYGEYELLHLYGKTYFKKGVITYKEFLWQLAAGAIVSYLIYHFKALTLIINLF